MDTRHPRVALLEPANGLADFEFANESPGTDSSLQIVEVFQ